MKRLFLAASSILCICLTSALADESPGQFQWTNGSEWGGQTLVAPRAVFCSTVPTVKLQTAAPPKARVLYGAIPAGDKKSAVKLGLALVRVPGQPTRVYLDANNDRIVTEAEGRDLKPNAVPLALCRGKHSTALKVDFMTKSRQRIAGPVAVWSGSVPTVLFFTWQGFLRGKLSIEGQPRTAFLVDGNANGTFSDSDFDQLWIDLNGDGRLDIVNEEFPVAPVQRLGEQVYNLSLAPGGSGSSYQVRLRRIEGGLGKAKVVVDERPGTAVKDLALTLISQAGDVASAQTVGEEFEIPTGKYHISSLTFEMTDQAARPWTYSFSNWVDSKEDKDYPVTIDRGAAADVMPFRNLTFDAKVEGERKPGGTLRIELSAKSEMNLELTNTVQEGANRYGTADYARMQLVNPSGKTVATASSGFS
ncbi:MAG TPA: hypothetical protein VNA16_04500 [Abditibacteriaceae bacterium]|nr:hypothetical protein [Abditibacteriaceae bacterium]